MVLNDEQNGYVISETGLMPVSWRTEGDSLVLQLYHSGRDLAWPYRLDGDSLILVNWKSDPTFWERIDRLPDSALQWDVPGLSLEDSKRMKKPQALPRAD